MICCAGARQRHLSIQPGQGRDTISENDRAAGKSDRLLTALWRQDQPLGSDAGSPGERSAIRDSWRTRANDNPKLVHESNDESNRDDPSRQWANAALYTGRSAHSEDGRVYAANRPHVGLGDLSTATGGTDGLGRERAVSQGHAVRQSIRDRLWPLAPNPPAKSHLPCL